MPDLSDLEILAQRYLEHLLGEQDVRFRDRRFMDDEKTRKAEYHAEQTGLFRDWIKRDEWESGSFYLQHEWPDGWALADAPLVGMFASYPSY